MTRVAALLLLVAACRERVVPADARVATGSAAKPVVATAAPESPRLLYSGGPSSFVDLVARSRHGVVAIRAGSPVKSGPAAMFPGAPDAVADVALGTGFLVENRGVFVVTNDHIAAAASELHVVLPDHSEVPAKLVGRDTRLDLALLSIDVPRLAPLHMGNSDDLQVGEWVVALGDPFGDEVTASAGIVSATGREAASSLLQGAAMTYRMFIQTDARIHRGNSGGPVLNAAGEVIGVAVATGDRTGELSFVIPINRVREIFDALRDYGQVARGWLGAMVKPVTADLATDVALPQEHGALITEIKPGSPAARSGLRAGDIIIKWGEQAVDDKSLPWIVASNPIGKAVAVTVWRNKAALPIPVVTEKMPQ
ncbi:MAG: trypsin-like peptidase domain-containing protein [Deltaproteobacteria bacterium]|nr:trypsin-like peptidase domain-containing protein [Deltaproteobacteria bacterium]